ADRPEVLGQQVLVADLDREVLLDEVDQMEQADRIDDALLQERRVDVDLLRLVHDELARDVLPDSLLDRVHLTSPWTSTAPSGPYESFPALSSLNSPCRSILPVEVFGSPSRRSNSWGIMYFGRMRAQCATRSPFETSTSEGTTTARSEWPICS